MYYGFKENGSMLDQVIFVDAKVINKSNKPFIQPALANYRDARLHTPTGRIGRVFHYTDSLLQMPFVFSYDSSWIDSDVPVYGFLALNDTIDYHIYMIDGGSTGLQYTHEQVRLMHFGKWPTGAHIGYGENFLHFPDSNSTPTNYIFTGKPETGEGWLQHQGSSAGRHLFSVTDPVLMPGDTFAVEKAYFVAIDSTGGHKESIALLRQRAAQLKTWYAQNKVEWPAGPCSGIPASANERGENAAPDWKMYPNPTQEMLTIDWPHTQTVVNIYSITGSLMLTTQIQEGLNTLDVSKLNEGMYIVMPEEKVGVRKLVIR
jgi:hypothetical protein